MIDPRLWKIWGIAKANLKSARGYLVDAVGEASEHLLEQFDEYLAHNEFGLAIDELAGVADELNCKAAFWKCLEAAAEAMELPESALTYKERFYAEVRRR